MTKNKQFKTLIFCLELISEEVLKEAFAQENSLLHNFQILNINKLPMTASSTYNHCFALNIVVGSLDDRDLWWRQSFDRICHQLRCDYCLLESGQSFKQPKLAVFDMDSTLIPMEVIDELAGEANVKDQVSHITEAAMRGELDFDQSFEQRLALLKGMPYDAVEAVRARLKLNVGVESLINDLADGGAIIGVASGGFEPFIERLSESIRIHNIKANQLEFDDGLLTGRAIKPIVNAQAKADIFNVWREQLDLEVAETVAIGDGANDELMLKSAGIGVAYKAKPYLRQRADCVLQFADMDALMDILEVASKELI
jgi:phosphoserine phosphatase